MIVSVQSQGQSDSQNNQNSSANLHSFCFFSGENLHHQLTRQAPCTETWRSQAESPSVIEHLHSKQNKRQVKPKPLVVATQYLANLIDHLSRTTMNDPHFPSICGIKKDTTKLQQSSLHKNDQQDWGFHGFFPHVFSMIWGFSPHVFHDLGIFPWFSQGFPNLSRQAWWSSPAPLSPPPQAVALQRQRIAEFHGAREELHAEVRDAHLEQIHGKN